MPFRRRRHLIRLRFQMILNGDRRVHDHEGGWSPTTPRVVAEDVVLRGIGVLTGLDVLEALVQNSRHPIAIESFHREDAPEVVSRSLVLWRQRQQENIVNMSILSPAKIGSATSFSFSANASTRLRSAHVWKLCSSFLNADRHSNIRPT